MEKNLIVCLHGFLGQPTDWNFLKPWAEQNNFEIYAPNLFVDADLNPEISFQDWPTKFYQKLDLPKHREKLLLGYSMGGRLGLNALLQKPEAWDQALMISVNLGIQESEKAQRLEQDTNWAQRFQKDEWSALVANWNKQGVFKNSHSEPKRNEKDFSRKSLSQALINWSVAKQADFRDQLKEVETPITWIAGEEDHKYADMADEALNLNDIFQGYILKDASHRVHFDQPEKIIKILNMIE